jgi:anti-sigma-K factor RskA
MTDARIHLTEDERQSFGDDSLPAEKMVAADAHIRTCATCAADVARIRTLMIRVHDIRPPATAVDDLWPSIRARIDESKVVPLPPATGAFARSHRRSAAWVGLAGATAAAIVIAIALGGRGEVRQGSAPVHADTTSVSLIAAADSAHAYQEEAQTLLNKLELQRATLRPEAAKALERDLHVVDVAIAELEDAIARDPNKRAVRQRLASASRQ